MEETFNVESLFPWVEKFHDDCETEFRSSVEKSHASNEFYVVNILVLLGDAISRAKIPGCFTNYMKLMVEKYVIIELKFRGVLLWYILIMDRVTK